MTEDLKQLTLERIGDYILRIAQDKPPLWMQQIDELDKELKRRDEEMRVLAAQLGRQSALNVNLVLKAREAETACFEAIKLLQGAIDAALEK